MTCKDRHRPFDDVRRALALPPGAADGSDPVTPSIRLDPGRSARTGVPEVIFAERKTSKAVTTALARQADLVGRALASRCSAETADYVSTRLGERYHVLRFDDARAVVVARHDASLVPTGARVGIIGAGTSDLPVAAEAALMAREMGATVDEVWDVGVAGLHRLVAPLERLMENRVDVIVVAAGMDGALPSVVAGLVDVPVIGLPTSVGYGFGGAGTGALGTMLQSCAPGLVVVNIDNGIGAGATAALIANRVAKARESVSVAPGQ